MNREEMIRLIAWIYISQTVCSAHGRLLKLWDEYADPLDICRAFSEKSNACTAYEIKNYADIHKDDIIGIISYCERHNIEIIPFDSHKYPDGLRRISNPPAVIYCKGKTDILTDNIIVAIVGTRKPSEYGIRATQSVAAETAAGGITIASGFAVGTDITAHLAAVRNGGRTVAVLGSGLDYPYPKDNLQYIDEILENGVFVSEYPPETPPSSSTFPARNRILTAISSGTAVMEASRKSGSLNSAAHAISQGKELFVLPPRDIFDPAYDGNCQLLRDSAIPICSPDDIVREYFENYSRMPAKEHLSDIVIIDSDPEGGLLKRKRKKSSSSKDKAPLKDVSEDNNENISHDTHEEKNYPAALDGNPKIIYDIINNAEAPASIEFISAVSGIGVDDVLSAVTDMELEGIVSSDDGMNYNII